MTGYGASNPAYLPLEDMDGTARDLAERGVRREGEDPAPSAGHLLLATEGGQVERGKRKVKVPAALVGQSLYAAGKGLRAPWPIQKANSP